VKLTDQIDKEILFESLWLRCAAVSDSEEIEASIAKARMHGLSELAICALRAETLRLAGQPEEAHKHLAELHSLDSRMLRLELPKIIVCAFHCLGFLERWLGRFDAAADAFLGALECDPGHIPSLHALQFTAASDACLERLSARLRKISFATRNQQSLARFRLADWSYRLGQNEESLILSFQAAKLSCSEKEQMLLDHLSLPSFPEAIIIGPPKCGTTSLAAWLGQHSAIYMHPSKELHFFDNYWDRGASWYRCQFPCFRNDDSGVLRMEATPNYLQMPDVAQRILELMPGVKLIAIFRNPFYRAISAYHHIQRQAGIIEDLNSVMLDELNELEFLPPEQIENFGWHRTNCLFGSLYSVHIQKWQRLFDKNQLLCLQLESLVENPEAHWQKIIQFLDLPEEICPGSMPSRNMRVGPVSELSPALALRASEVLGASMDFWGSLAMAT
jgi:tetratricopeptide (TPR) repeat protein